MPALKTETNTTAIEYRIKGAFQASDYNTDEVDTFSAHFEHGQWWIIVITVEGSERDEITYSVVDASGGNSVDGFDFEEV